VIHSPLRSRFFFSLGAKFPPCLSPASPPGMARAYWCPPTRLFVWETFFFFGYIKLRSTGLGCTQSYLFPPPPPSPETMWQEHRFPSYCVPTFPLNPSGHAPVQPASVSPKLGACQPFGVPFCFPSVSGNAGPPLSVYVVAKLFPPIV